MNKFLSFVIVALLLWSGLAVAQSECAQFTRSDLTETLTAETWRPLSATARSLSSRFGIIVSAEDPNLIFTGDLTDTTAQALPEWRRTHPSTRVYIPKAWRLQVTFGVKKDGTPEDIASRLQQVVDAANAQSRFEYRLDSDGEFNAFVPTRTRDAAGTVVESVPLLDRRVDIPAGVRSIAEDGDMLAQALSTQTGLRVSCCQTLGRGIPWGVAKVPFEAHDEAARKVLERLIRLDQQSEQRSFSSNVYWLVSCDPNAIDGPRYCFIDLQPVGSQCW